MQLFPRETKLESDQSFSPQISRLLSPDTLQYRQNRFHWGPENQRKLSLDKAFPQPSGSWTSAPKIVDVRTKSAFSCGPSGGEKLFDPWASGRKGQECPREIRTKKFMFMLFVPDAAFFAYSWKLPAYSGAFLLTVDSSSFFTYNWSFFAYNFSFSTYSWSFFAYSGKVRLIGALRDCKQRS